MSDDKSWTEKFEEKAKAKRAALDAERMQQTAEQRAKAVAEQQELQRDLDGTLQMKNEVRQFVGKVPPRINSPIILDSAYKFPTLGIEQSDRVEWILLFAGGNPIFAMRQRHDLCELVNGVGRISRYDKLPTMMESLVEELAKL
jgi:hypothetical protein